MRSIHRSVTHFCLAWLIATPCIAADLVVVMDDLGNNFGRDRQVLELPGQVTLALLPFAPHSARMARLADEQGKEVILHQPMQSQRERRRNEDGNLRIDMSDTEFETTLSQSLAAIPHIVGINNHTGSLLTEHHDPMTRVMQALQQSGLFFLDSRTTPNTVAPDVAAQMGVPTLSRDVFLDHSRDPDAIHRQFQRAMRIARKTGRAIVIAHPYPETFEYLYEALYNLPSDVQLTSLSDLMPSSKPVIEPTPLPEQPNLELNPDHQIALAPPADPESPHKSLGR